MAELSEASTTAFDIPIKYSAGHGVHECLAAAVIGRPPGDSRLCPWLGICRLIDQKKISLENGIQMFDIERQLAVMERSMEDAAHRRQQPLSEDDLEPVG